MTNEAIIYSVIVPLYNEELVIDQCYKRLKKVMDIRNEPYEIIFVNDGSKDKTMIKVSKICEIDQNIKLINFSRNFGHQTAITAGMDYANGTAIIIIDADLQDPPEIINMMISKWREGNDVVYGKRLKRNGETFFKKLTAKIFYRTLTKLTSVDIPVDTGDFRLIDRKVCNTLKSIPERNRYVRGLVSWVGFKQTAVEYIRDERYAGETKYPLRKMIKLAKDGITSFSYKPLTISIYMGIIICLLGIAILIAFLSGIIFIDKTRFSLLPLISMNMFINGLILIILGITGEYIGRIYDETKGRPQYIVSTKIGFEDNKLNTQIETYPAATHSKS